MTELCDIALKYGTDKCPQLKHHFTEFYYACFVDRRETVKKVLEIGIGNISPNGIVGASLRMWHDWFPNAQIYGADIDKSLLFQDGRIQTLWCDQTSDRLLKDLVFYTGSDLDLVIDDGLHTPASQLFTCKMLMPLLNKDVMYVIEDAAYVDVNDLSEYYASVFQPRHRRYRDDRLVIVRHKDV